MLQSEPLDYGSELATVAGMQSIYDERCGPTSRSSVALDELLDRGGDAAEAIRTRFHRTMLWRLRTGRRLPEIETATELHRLSGGRVPIDGWTEPAATTHATPR